MIELPASEQTVHRGDTAARLRPEAAVAAAGLDRPLLVVATSRTVARFAPAWAAAGSTMAGYRVLVIRENDPSEVQQIVAEATSLGAAGIIAVGGTSVIAAATAAGRQVHRPVVPVPASG